MRRAEPRLQRTLLAWLLGPLSVLLVLDAGVAYWTSLYFSNRAYDRALGEIARELVLHVRPEEGRLRLVIAPAAEQILLVDQEDRLVYRLATESGGVLGGDAAMPPPVGLVPGGPPRFYEDQVRGEPVRMFA